MKKILYLNLVYRSRFDRIKIDGIRRGFEGYQYKIFFGERLWYLPIIWFLGSAWYWGGFTILIRC